MIIKLDSVPVGRLQTDMSLWCAVVATRTEQEAEESGSPTKTPGSETRFTEYLTITTLDVTPDDSKSNSFARGQHVTRSPMSQIGYELNTSVRAFSLLSKHKQSVDYVTLHLYTY